MRSSASFDIICVCRRDDTDESNSYKTAFDDEREERLAAIISLTIEATVDSSTVTTTAGTFDDVIASHEGGAAEAPPHVRYINN